MSSDSPLVENGNDGNNDLRQQVAEGLFYTHVRLSQGTNKTLDNQIVNPNIDRADWPQCKVSQEVQEITA